MKTQGAKWAVLFMAGMAGACGVAPAEESEAPVAEQSLALRNIGVGPIGGPVIVSVPPEDPDVATQKPRKPLPAVVTPKSASQLSVAWVDRSSFETGFHVYRGPGSSGPWTLIATVPASAGLDATVRYTDSGLGRDSYRWYQIGAFNGYGESLSVPGGAYTLDGRGSVSRVQVRFHTASVSDANSDDDVHVALNYYEENHGTYLDYGRDDFERGDTFTYDLMTEDVSDLSHINELYIFKTGTDGWCFDRLTLLVNEVPVYDESLSSCRWLDNEGGSQNYYIVPRALLRAHPLWQAYTATIPAPRLTRLDLAQRLEGFIGNMIHTMSSLGLSWAGSARDQGYFVQVTRQDATAVHVVFTLGANQSSLIPGNEAEATISFDLRFTGICRTATAPPQVLMALENPQASLDFSTLSHLETLGIINFFRDDITSAIVGSFPKIQQTLTLDNRLACVMPVVASDGTVDFDLTFRTTTPGTVGGINLGTKAVATATFSN